MADFEEHFQSNTLVVAFAGGPQNQFQWGRVLKGLGLPHVLLRDSTQRHYVDGIPGMCSVQGFRGYVAKVCEIHKFDRVILTGVSSGAYAALMYGVLARGYVDKVIAISPITGRGPSTAADFDPKYRDQIIDPNQPDLDLKPLFARGYGLNMRVCAYISDGPGCELDRGMAERIGIKDINLVPGYSHGDLARGMRDKGMFKELFCV